MPSGLYDPHWQRPATLKNTRLRSAVVGNLRGLIGFFLKLRAFLGTEMLQALIESAKACPELVDKAWPLPTAGGVRGYLECLGVVSPAANVIEPPWEAVLADTPQLICGDVESQILVMYESSPGVFEADLTECIESIAAEQNTAIDPATIALILQAITMLIELIKKRRNPQPNPGPLV
jgi:hypothetical protein